MTEPPQPWEMPGVGRDEAELLRRAAACPLLPGLSDISIESLRSLTESKGVELATAVLFDRVVRSHVHGLFIQRLELLRLSGSGGSSPRLRATLLIVPGAYYVEYPDIGGDGRVLYGVAEVLNCRVELIRTVSVGGLAKNAELLSRALQSHPEPVILISLSKGGADVKAALSRPNAAAAFGNVVAWVDFCGIFHGTPLARRIVDSRLLTALARSLFWLRSHDYDFVRDLVPRPGGPLDGQLHLPPAMRAIHVVGFPLLRHPTTPLIQRHYRRLAPQGPNDGCTLLGTIASLPGLIYPIWGVDHYLRPTWNIQTLVRAILLHLGEECGLIGMMKGY